MKKVQNMATAKIVRKYIIKTAIKTHAPIRIASGIDDGITDIIVLKTKENKALIPGSSLSGVLRAAIGKIYGQAAAEFLFGFINNEAAGHQSMINVGDIVLNSHEVVKYDGVAIDTFRGVGKSGQKYDYEAVERGAEGFLEIEITVRQRDLADAVHYEFLHDEFKLGQDFTGELVATIADLLTQGLNVGSLTAKGYGLIKSSQNVNVYCFDFQKTDAVTDWLNYITDGSTGEPWYVGKNNMLNNTSAKDFVMEACFSIKNSLIIRDYNAVTEEDGDKNVKLLTSLKSRNDYLIPGTSIKGVIRNRAAKILFTLSHGKNANDFLKNLMGYAENKSQKSRFSVENVYLDSSKIIAEEQYRNRINRFTGGTISGALFAEKVIRQKNENDMTICLKAKVSECLPQEAGLVLLVLKDLWLGRLAIGGGKGIGRGVLIGRKCRILYNGEEYVIDNEKLYGDSERNLLKLEAYVTELVEYIQKGAVHS